MQHICENTVIHFPCVSSWCSASLLVSEDISRDRFPSVYRFGEHLTQTWHADTVKNCSGQLNQDVTFHTDNLYLLTNKNQVSRRLWPLCFFFFRADSWFVLQERFYAFLKLLKEKKKIWHLYVYASNKIRVNKVCWKLRKGLNTLVHFRLHFACCSWSDFLLPKFLWLAVLQEKLKHFLLTEVKERGYFCLMYLHYCFC